MVRSLILCLLLGSTFFPGYSQTDTTVSANRETRVYSIKPAIEIPVTGAISLWCFFTLPKIYNKPRPTEEQILNLKISDINAFDRGAVYAYSKAMHNASDLPFYTAIPLPFVFFLTGKNMRHDYGQLSMLYWETMAAIGLLGTTATAFVDRYRPYAYFHDTREATDRATSTVARNSFYAGHVEIVTASTFFIAKVYADYHPESRIKWVYYGVASIASVSTGYMRIKGGAHFLSDVLLGLTTGSLSGILVPQYHKKDRGKNGGMGILPFHNGDANGLTLTCTIR